MSAPTNADDTLFGEQMKISGDAIKKGGEEKLFSGAEMPTGAKEKASRRGRAEVTKSGKETNSVSFPSSLEKILSMRISDGSVPEALTKTKLGSDITYQEAILLAQVMKALNGDTQAAVFVRDSSGNKPKDCAVFTKSKKFEDL
ncbi:MAG: hypothetical protein ACI3XX_01035 [Eubacteriales bacterium]